MDTLLKNMDHARDGCGLPVTITGQRARIQRLLIRLGVRKGSFLPDPQLGSELHKLPLALAGQERDQLALHYAQQALLPERARVERAFCRPSRGQPDSLSISLSIRLGGQTFPLEVAV